MTPLWSEELGRWVPNSECDHSGRPYALKGEPRNTFASYCPHCGTGDPGEDYCASCGEKL